MSPLFILGCISVYFTFLLLIAWYTSRNANKDAYFLGNKSSPWYAVAFGMIGDSLSGVTFISVPGAVYYGQFAYLQLVLGYLVGYWIIADILLPLYYRLNLTSIYSYLQQRFGVHSQKTGSFFFLLSRLLGAGGRLYLAVAVIQIFVFDNYHIPFAVSVFIIILLILIYTFKGGIKTLVWTDTFQSTFLLLGVVLSIAAIANNLDYGVGDIIKSVQESPHSKVFFWDWKEKNFFIKQFLGGAFIAVAMTGLDQNMMQKNLSCRSLREAKLNMKWFSLVLVIVNLFFISLGALLYHFADSKGVALPTNSAGKVVTDTLFPSLALNHLGAFAGIVFIIGLTAATFSSADSVLTSLTTSFYIDFLKYDTNEHLSESAKTQRRNYIHFAFAVLLLLVILVFKAMNDDAIVNTVLTLAGFTYGPLLGLFAFGLFTRYQIKDYMVPFVCIICSALAYVINQNAEKWLGGYKFGFEFMIFNGFLTFAGLLLIREKRHQDI